LYRAIACGPTHSPGTYLALVLILLVLLALVLDHVVVVRPTLVLVLILGALVLILLVLGLLVLLLALHTVKNILLHFIYTLHYSHFIQIFIFCLDYITYYTCSYEAHAIH
jgi:hypothetical protein